MQHTGTSVPDGIGQCRTDMVCLGFVETGDQTHLVCMLQSFQNRHDIRRFFALTENDFGMTRSTQSPRVDFGKGQTIDCGILQFSECILDLSLTRLNRLKQCAKFFWFHVLSLTLILRGSDGQTV